MSLLFRSKYCQSKALARAARWPAAELWFGVLLLIGLCFLSLPALADTAVAFTDDVQTYGYCFDEEDASTCAEYYCTEGANGQICRTRFRSEELGHFALALGSRGWGIGFSASDAERAGASAMSQCWQQTQGCRVVESWYNSKR